MVHNPQKAHYEKIHDAYKLHYYDTTSMKYRHKFIYNYLFKDLDLNNKEVADLACGSGYNSLSLKEYFPEARITGFDISETACTDYSQLLNRPAVLTDLTVKNSIPQEYKEKFDVVMIIGGLHHCVADLDQTFENIFEMLKPNGFLLMMEPNKKYFLEAVRKFWYKRDRFFDAETEEALSHNEIFKQNKNRFISIQNYHLGGPAFFLILNSLIFRIPLGLKKIIYYPLIALEYIYNLLPSKIMYPYFVAQWKKNESN